VCAAAALVAAACGSSSGTQPSTTKSGHPVAVSSPKPGITLPAAMTSPPDPLLLISKRCLLTMAQVQTLSSVIFGLSPAPSSQTSPDGVNECLYSGSFAAGNSPTQFLSISVMSEFGPLPHHAATQPGFYNGQAGIIHVSNSSLVMAGAQIMSGQQHGQWLVLVVGNNGPPLVSLHAIEVALSQAETQYLHPNAGAQATLSSSPTASTGGNTSGNTPASDVACKLITRAQADTFAPPDANPPLHAVVTGSGSHQFSAGTTDYICGFAFWTGDAVNQGMEDGSMVLDLACGPNASNSMLSDEVNTPTFTIGSTTAAIGLTRYKSSSGTGDPQAVLSSAESVAKSINACG
jgi:hypothetical protein